MSWEDLQHCFVYMRGGFRTFVRILTLLFTYNNTHRPPGLRLQSGVTRDAKMLKIGGGSGPKIG
jgi:hypothetical protein